MLKSVALYYSTTPVEYDFEKFKEKLPEDTFTDSVEISMSNSKFILEAVRQITIKGIIPGELEKAIFGYLIFMFFLSWFVVSAMGLVYYRKFKSQ